MPFNDSLDMQNSYYVATANRHLSYGALEGNIDADVIVVGGGCTGITAALHAAEAGLSVVLLEGGKIGWGASGRNGGQMIPGLRKGVRNLVSMFGTERAREIFETAFEARQLVLDLIERHRIECDLKLTGHVVGIVKSNDIPYMIAEAESLRTVMGRDYANVIPAAEVRQWVNVPYEAAYVDRLGGHMHPLNYTLGLASAASNAGVKIFENSVAIELDRGPPAVVHTARGSVRAKSVILAGDALLKGLAPEVNNRIMPVANYLVATRPLPFAHELIPSDAAISDSRFVVNYFRRTADNRILFGGGEKYTPKPPRDIATFVRPYIESTFPALTGLELDFAWGGLVSVTSSRLPHIGRTDNVFFAHGYSGMGVILSSLAGRLLADEIQTPTRAFQVMASLKPRAFPGGTALRFPLYVLGMLWYAMRDRL